MVAIDMSQVAVLIGPLIPDAHTIVLKILDIGITIEKPKQFVDDGLQVQLLCCKTGESLLEVESHLVPKHADGACARAVALLFALRKDTVEQI